MITLSDARTLILRCFAAVILWSCCLSAQAQDLLLREVVSREFSVTIEGGSAAGDAISRELSISVESGRSGGDVASRELSLAVYSEANPPRIDGLAVSPSATGDRVNLDWSDYNPWQYLDVAEFRIYLSDSGPIFDVSILEPVLTVSGEITRAELLGLSELTDHFLAVVAVDSGGNFDPSVNYAAAYVLSPELVSRELSVFVGGTSEPSFRESVSREFDLAIVPASSPPAIDDLSVTVSAQGDSAELSWDRYNQWANAPVERFDIYLSDTGAIEDVSGLIPVATVSGLESSVELSGLTTGTDHFFAVVPVDSSGNFEPAVNYSAAYVLSPEVISRELSVFVGSREGDELREVASREFDVLVPSSDVPAPVTGANSGFFVETSRSEFGAVDLNFESYNESAQLDVVSYNVYVADAFFDDVTSLTPFGVLPAGDLSPTLEGLSGGAIHHFAVVAVDALGGFDPVVRSFSAQASISGVGEVISLAGSGTATELTFTWDAPEEASAFLQGYQVSVGAGEPITLPLTQTSYTMADLIPATGYTFRISTIDIFGNASPGRSLNASTWLPHPGDQLLTLVGESVVLQWAGVESSVLVGFYEIYSSFVPFSDVSGMTPLGTTFGTSFTLGSLSEVQDRYFAVATVNILGDKDPSVASLQASKSQQTISFPSPTLGGLVIPLEASSTSALTVRYESSDPSIAVVEGSSLRVLRGGAVTVTAFQNGNADFWPAMPVEQSLRVAPVITSFTANNEEVVDEAELGSIDEILRVFAEDKDGISAAEFFLRPVGGAESSLGRDIIPGDGLTALLSLDAFPAGDYILRVRVETPEGVFSELSRTVRLMLSVPPAPLLVSPQPGTSVESEQVTVSGTVVRGATVSLFLNGVQPGSAVTPVDGVFSAVVTLSPGENVVVATAVNSAGQSPPSTPLVVNLRSLLTLSATPQVQGEGQSIQVVVGRNHSQGDVSLRFSESVFGQLRLPTGVVLADGQESVTATVETIDDAVAEIDEAVTLTVGATGYTPASQGLTIRDDDRPSLTLSLNRDTISEGETNALLIATLTRSPATGTPFEVLFSNSNPAALEAPGSTVFPAFTETIEVVLRPVDNDIVNDDQLVSLSAQILDVTTDQSIASSDPVSLTVTDDDGAALVLALASDSLQEGETVLATLQRTETSGALDVSLTTDLPGALNLPSSMRFEDGVQSVEFLIEALENQTADGNRSALISANAPDFSSSQVLLTVTDLDLPELAISRIALPSTAETGGLLSYNYRIENRGSQTAIGPFATRVFLSTDAVLDDEDEQVNRFVFDGELPAGLFFERSETLFTPNVAGPYWLIFQVDSNDSVVEILEGNNLRTSDQSVEVEAAYSATVSAEMDLAPSGTPIELNGLAINRDGSPAAFKLVNVNIEVRETLRTLSALTNSDGRFSLTFTPLPGEGGIYTIGASHPGVVEWSVQDSFTLLGFSTSPAGIETRVTRNAGPVTGSLTLGNFTDVVLSGVSIEALDFGAGVDVQADLSGGVTTMERLAETTLTWSISADSSAESEISGRLRITSVEGAVREIPVELTLRDQTSRLSYTSGRLETGMVPGTQSSINFVVTNEGSVTTGPLDILLPNTSFLSSATISPAPGIAPGESAEISLLLSPPADIALTAFNGVFQVRGAHNAVDVPFSFRALSDATGDLVVRCEDEYTYFAASTPPLAEALVVLCDAVDGSEVARGTTGVSGEFTFADLREGYYQIKVSAERHNPYRNTFYLAPGQTTIERAFLPRVTVEYVWNVVPTEIEDRYRIVVETVFEANVPAPVVTIEPAFITLEDFTEDLNQVDLTITNHGLIAADDVGISLGSTPEWQLSSIATQLGTLPAKSSITVPLIIERQQPPGPLPAPLLVKSAAKQSGRCGSPVVCTDWTFQCGDIEVSGTACVGFSRSSGCGAAVNPRGGRGGGGSVRVSPSPVSGGGIVSCDPCILKVILTCFKFKCNSLASCIGYAIAGDVGKCVSGIVTAEDAFGVLYGGVKCACSLAKITPQTKLACDVVKCLVETLKCLDRTTGPAPSSIRFGKSASSLDPLQKLGEEAEVLFDFFAVEETIYGSRDWFEYFGEDDFSEWSETLGAAMDETGQSGGRIDSAESAELMAMPFAQRTDLIVDPMAMIVRWNRTIDYYESGIFEVSQLGVNDDADFIARSEMSHAAERSQAALVRADANGFPNVFDPYFEAQDNALIFLTSGEGVCAKVKLQLEQEAVMTRDAFEASLDIINNDPAPIENLDVSIRVTTPEGLEVTSLFGITDPEITNVSGDRLAGNTTGSWRWTLIPTQGAAPAGETVYLVEGLLSYVQAGESVTIPLAPQSITVFPSPNLRLKYFHQRDVFSDDPFTDIIEPSIPFNLGVMVENSGLGPARNLRIVSGQPEIIENDKGLFIDFEIIATEVAGQSLSPSLTADFDTIAPGEIKIGRWLMTSTLQGLFVDYEADFEHLDDLGDPRLSLIESVEIFETIRQVRALGAKDDGLPDFLVNQDSDLADLPDTIHLSDGSTAPVAVSQSAMSSAPDTENLTVTLTSTDLAQPGWTYLRVPDPADGAFRLASVMRSDGLVIPLDENVWVTDRTFIGFGRQPIRENVLHLLDCDGTGSYELTYVAVQAPDTTPPMSSITQLPAASGNFFPVSWVGNDDREVASYDIYLSQNAGPFVLWLDETRQTSALFEGETGSSYDFFSIARDASGNEEPLKIGAEAGTTVSLENQAPILSPIGDVTILEGQTFRLRPAASDPDGPSDLLRYSVQATPLQPGLTINPISGRLRWITGEENGGSSVSVTVTVTDGAPAPRSASQTFTLTVSDTNSAPRLQSPERIVLDVGDPLSVQLVAEDADEPRQILTYSAINAPVGLSVNPQSGLVTWTPGESAEEQTFEVLLEVRDDQTPPGIGNASLFIEVLKRPGEPPAFDDLPILIWPTESTRMFTVRANDPEGEPVTVSLDLGMLDGWVTKSEGSETGEATLFWNTTGVTPGAYEVPLIAGTDRQTTRSTLAIQIVSLATYTTYLEWAEAYGLDASQTGLLISNNPQQISNLMAYALQIDPVFGISPAQPEPRPQVMFRNDQPELNFFCPDGGRLDLRYRIRYRPDLATGQWSTLAEKVGAADWDGLSSPQKEALRDGIEAISFPVLDPDQRGFLRLEVEALAE